MRCFNWAGKLIDTNKINIFSDGSSLGNPGPGGFGVIMKWKNKKVKISKGFRYTTNNRMELLGPITALNKLKKPQEILLTTDSKYVIDGIEKGWARKWKNNHWMRDKKNSALNVDLWDELLNIIDFHISIKFLWVRGHQGHPENEECDLLAKNAAMSDNLNIDKKFEEKVKFHE